MSDNVTKRTDQISGCSISMDDIVRLYKILIKRLTEAADIEINDLKKLENETEQEFEELKASRRAFFQITIVINGQAGEQIFGSDEGIFSSPNLPDRISSVYMDSKATYTAHRNNIEPRNWFGLLLDFSKPPLLDWVNPVSNPTPNASNLIIHGDSEAWVAAVRHTVIERLKQHSNRRSFLHKPLIYDAGMWLIGIPAAFLGTASLMPKISGFFRDLLPTIEYAAYVYVFFAVLVIYRFLFSYTKWAWPTVELTSTRNVTTKHRRYWYAVLVGLSIAFIWSLIKW